MPEPPTPDWRFLEREIQSLASTARAIAVRAACDPEVVLDALAETLSADAAAGARAGRVQERTG